MRLRATDVAAATGGELLGPDVPVDGARIDSRLVRGGELFVALRAERDGHDFVAAAFGAGAAACLVSTDVGREPAIVVPDTAAALTALATAARDRLPARVLAVTGSVGKTSTKDLLAAALGRCFRVSASPKSFNNELGVPLTLLDTPDDAEALVVEMGARGAGHVAALCAVARPDVGVVTTVGLSHAEFFGTIDDVVAAKGELVEALPGHGTAVLNADVPAVAGMASRTTARVVTFGLLAGDVRAEDVSLDDDLRPTFRLASPWGGATVRLAVRGHHQVANALAAAAAALACGTAVDDVAEGLGDARLSPWRMQLERAPSGALVLNDTYNANPLSTEAALRALAALPAERRAALLGVMAELGTVGPAEHARMGALAAELGIRLIAVAAPHYGGEQAVDAADALDRLGRVGHGDAVLVKGSRAAGLEAVAGTLAGS
jgi:UDP-N-acetylmuramoyl-tripeptide--D-alanyl-D-alanine ligase